MSKVMIKKLIKKVKKTKFRENIVEITTKNKI